MGNRGLLRTLRIRTRRRIGNLGVVTAVFGDTGVSVGEIITRKIGHNYTVRDFNLFVDDDEHLASVIEAINNLPESEVVEVIQEVKRLHQGGLIRTESQVNLDSITDFDATFTPGVLEMVRIIDEQPALVDTYTSLPLTVAIVSDGADFPGEGKVSPQAMMPILEGQAALLAKHAGLHSLPLALQVRDEDTFAETLMNISPSCRAMILHAVSATRARRIIQQLNDKLSIPIFHADADAAAICGLASFINACRLVGLDTETVRVGQVGLGTAGGAVARLVMRYLNRPVLGDDVHPGALNRHTFYGGKVASLEDIMNVCDVVIANTGHSGSIPTSMVRRGQVIIALSEPRPDIEPFDALLAGAAYAADGKAVNTAVVFPGLVLGALAVKASQLNDSMRIAAAVTIADLAEDGDLVPSPLLANVHVKVAAAVARAAIHSGVAQANVDTDMVTAEYLAGVVAGQKHLPIGVF